jgi:DNA-binding NarL/FixJ family response regulator
MTTAAIIDDHALVRGGLSGLLADLGLEVVHQGVDPAALLALDPVPDLVLLDLDLGGTPADPVLAGRLQERGCRVLVVSAMADSGQVAAMVEAGVAGFVSKRESPETLAEAVRTVLVEGSWVSPEVAAVLLAGQRRPSLTDVQRRVLVLYASGMKLDAVARTLDISPGTASTHLKRARAKYAELGRTASNRVDLYREVRRDGLLGE